MGLHKRISLGQDIMKLVEGLPALIGVKVTQVIEADGWHADNGLMTLDLLVQCILGREEVRGGGKAVTSGIQDGRKLALESAGGGGEGSLVGEGDEGGCQGGEEGELGETHFEYLSIDEDGRRKESEVNWSGEMKMSGVNGHGDAGR